MKILKREDGLMLLEQYGKVYIRFAAGEVAEILYQVPITINEKEQVLTGNYSLESIVNLYSNKGEADPEVLLDNLIMDYLNFYTDYSSDRKKETIQILHKYGDIFFEFYYYVLRERMEDGVEVEGFNAKEINEKYSLSVLDAYIYLVYLKDEPQHAMQDLRRRIDCKEEDSEEHND